MKRVLIRFMLAFSLVLFMFPSGGHAQGLPLQIKVNGTRISFPDQQPFINQDDRTMVPIRFVSQSLGYQVNWNGLIKQVSISNAADVVQFAIGSRTVLLNGAPQTIDTEAALLNERTMVPLRFVAQFLSAEVQYDAATNTVSITQAGAAASVYDLQLQRWNIYNDGTHPVETTKGFNDALVWAHEQGFTVFKVPAGTYLVDKDSSIKLVSNMAFELDDKAVIQEETNGYPSYQTLLVGPDVHDTIIKGGTYIGDRDTHDFSAGGTQESGNGIQISGGNHITIDHVKTEKFTGDGVTIGGYGLMLDDFYAEDFVQGAVNGQGELIPSTTQIRTKNPIHFTNPIFQTQHTISFWQPQNLSTNKVNVYFYKPDGTFLSAALDQPLNNLIPIPTGASYYYAVFDAPATKGVFMTYWSKKVSENITVENSESTNNRRQGITIGGGDHVQIVNNQIHDIHGTAPQYGIDVEGMGAYPNSNITIQQNHFYNNAGGDIVFPDGAHGVVDGNQFGDSIGVYVWEAFKDITLSNNTFNNSSITVRSNGSLQHNTMTNGRIKLMGTDIAMDDTTVTDGNVTLDGTTRFGVTVADLTMMNDDQDKYSTALTINAQPVHLANVDIKGMTSLWTLSGNGSDDSTYDHLTVEDYNVKNGTNLPAGTYNNCTFISNQAEFNPLVIQRSGKFVFNQCSFQNVNKAVVINSMYGAPDVTFKDSAFDLSGSNVTAVDIAGAHSFTFTGNTINALHLANPRTPIIHIGSIGSADKPTQVLGVSITGNTISTNVPASGIDTTGGGIGAPAYDIENNTLNNATLKLLPKDNSKNNKQVMCTVTVSMGDTHIG